MIFGNDRNQLRQAYIDAWVKAQQQLPMTALEQQISDVIAIHPEYHSMLTPKNDSLLEKEYLPEMGESNPFLHMGLHLGVRDQLATNRPVGITALFQKIITKMSDPHQAEHIFMETLAESIWLAQRNNQAPDEAKYLNMLKRKLKAL